MRPARSLASLCRGLLDVSLPALEIRHLSLDSRKVEAEGLFLACAGRRSHGLARLDEACERGARAVLWEPAAGVEAPQSRANVFMAPLPELSRHASEIAARFFGAPSEHLTAIGITGTNGKTTCSWLVADALNRLGRRTAYQGTLGSGVPGETLQVAEYTTLDAVALQQRLAELREAGADSIAMEVSSHALDQHRAAAVRFKIAAFTNLTRDHLDYHGTMDAYGAAKARLFAVTSLTDRVFNVDDSFGAELAARYAADAEVTGTLWLVARQSAGFAAIARCRALKPEIRALIARDLQRSTRGLTFVLEESALEDLALVDSAATTATHLIELPLIGEFNVDNALLAFAMLRALGFTGEAIAAALQSCSAPQGRMQAFVVPQHGMAIVDYAHTPDALIKALRAARGHCKGRLHLVFGCGGDRDAGKRAIMGRVAAEMADRVILTDDNPRSEAPAAIVADIRGGIESQIDLQVIHERAAAIITALQTAAVDDVVLIAGKGHEEYQIIGAERRAFSDSAVVREFSSAAEASA